MVAPDCQTCTDYWSCDNKKKARYLSKLLFAWANDSPIQGCGDYSPRWWHGIEGVLHSPRAPLGACHGRQSREVNSLRGSFPGSPPCG